jgi:hypothetical protein
VWRSAGVHRPWHAGRDTLENSGSPVTHLSVGKAQERHTAIEARRGDLETELGWSLKLGSGTTRQEGSREAAIAHEVSYQA